MKDEVDELEVVCPDPAAGALTCPSLKARGIDLGSRLTALDERIAVAVETGKLSADEAVIEDSSASGKGVRMCCLITLQKNVKQNNQCSW